MQTQAAQIDETVGEQITLARLCLIFAALALTIACVGLYGTVAYHVTRRTFEIGLRVALGAQRAGILWLVMREVLTMTAVGLASGLAAAIAGSRYLASFLYGVKPRDPLTLAGAALVLLFVAWLGGYLPARRAAGIDPIAALRHE